MDKKTTLAYSERASEYSQDWLAQPQPLDMYGLLKKYFQPGLKTADIGCGNGRDANWLSQNGFQVTGYDSSSELLDLARNLFPHVPFKLAPLPALDEIQTQYDNILCETVIMHLPKEQILQSLESLKRILKTNGILYLSWRATEGSDHRHNDGRLYSAFEPSFILNQFPPSSVLHFEDLISESSGKRVCRLIASGQP